MKTLEHIQWRKDNYNTISKIQHNLNAYKPTGKTVVVVYNDILHYIVSFSYNVAGNQYLKLRLKPTGPFNESSFTIFAHDDLLDINTVQVM